MVAWAMTSQKRYNFDFWGTSERPDHSQGSFFLVKMIIFDSSVLELSIWGDCNKKFRPHWALEARKAW